MDADSKAKIAFCYEGRINQSVLESLLKQLDGMSPMLGLTLEQRTRLSMVLIEQCQNIMKYGERNGDVGPMPDYERPGSVAFGRDGLGPYVSTACYIKPADRDALELSYRHIRDLSAQRLEEEYDRHRKSEDYKASRFDPSVGMGLLAVARHAAQGRDGQRRIDFEMETDNRAKTTVHVLH